MASVCELRRISVWYGYTAHLADFQRHDNKAPSVIIPFWKCRSEARMRRDKFGSGSTGTAIPVCVVCNRCRCTVYLTYRTANLLVQPKFILRRERVGGGGIAKKNRDSVSGRYNVTIQLQISSCRAPIYPLTWPIYFARMLGTMSYDSQVGLCFLRRPI